jgi:hypothetical protein
MKRPAKRKQRSKSKPAQIGQRPDAAARGKQQDLQHKTAERVSRNRARFASVRSSISSSLTRIVSSLAILPCLGFLALVPILAFLPIYPDEFQWRLMNARYFLDGGQALYFFPVCSNGFLNRPPLTSYPYWLINSLLYQNMSDTHYLRIYGLVTSIVLVIGVAMLLPRIVPLPYGLPARIGIVLSPLSLGVMPFLMGFNRPEQHLVVVVCLAFGLALLVRSREAPLSPRATWLLAAAYALLTTMLMASHMKGVFLMPALLVAAAAAIRRPLPCVGVVALASVSAWSTFLLWRDRTSCPESPFLTQVFRNVSLSPGDLKLGVGTFFHAVKGNLFQNFHPYWESVTFLRDNQTGWLPEMTFPPTAIERVVNTAIPVILDLAFGLIALGVLVSIVARAIGKRTPLVEPILALSLVGAVAGIAGLQITKNFYEATLILPVIGLAVLFSLRPLLGLPFARGLSQILLAGLIFLALSSQIAIAYRFYGNYSAWRRQSISARGETKKIENLVAQCGVRPDQTSSRVMMDFKAYRVLWPTREPLFLEVFSGYWGTGIDQDELLRRRKVSALVGECHQLPARFRSLAVASEGFCCLRLDKAQAK